VKDVFFVTKRMKDLKCSQKANFLKDLGKKRSFFQIDMTRQLVVN